MEMTNKYYNQDIKDRFLEHIDLAKYPPRWFERVFEKSILLETEKQRDLYDFSTTELLEFYKWMDIGNIASLVVLNANLGVYTEWALSENLIADNQTHPREITVELLNTCVSKARINNSILPFETLKHIRFANAQDGFVLWCLFEGIKGKEFEDILNIELGDIDVQNKTVKLHSGRTIKVSDEFIYMAIRADAEDEYIGLSNESQSVTFKLIPSDKIFKQKHQSRGVDLRRAVYSTVSRSTRCIPGLNSEQNAKSIRDSGLIHYLNERAKSLGMSTAKMLYDELENHSGVCQDIIDKYTFNMNTLKRWVIMYEDYLHDC